MPTSEADDLDVLRISFPARSGFLRISRLNAAAFGADLGLDVDDLDDLRLAVDEMVSWLLRDEASGGSVTIELSDHDGALLLRCTRSGSNLPEQPVDDLVHAILGATVDSYTFDNDATSRVVVCEKRHQAE